MCNNADGREAHPVKSKGRYRKEGHNIERVDDRGVSRAACEGSTRRADDKGKRGAQGRGSRHPRFLEGELLPPGKDQMGGSDLVNVKLQVSRIKKKVLFKEKKRRGASKLLREKSRFIPAQGSSRKKENKDEERRSGSLG